MVLSKEQKEANKIERARLKAEAKELARIEAEKTQRPVKELTISIEWKKSYSWGSNPHAQVRVSYHNGGYEFKEGYTCSGCGYDKESTVVAEIFNDFLKYKLWNKTIEQCERKDYKWKEENGSPIGISAGTYKNSYGNEIEYRSYNGGIGTNCYNNISEFIGGKFEHIASGKTFDVYKWTDNE